MRKMKRFFVNSKGFTLIELLAVVAILAILAGIGIPRVLSAISDARSAADTANIELLRQATYRAIVQGTITLPASGNTRDVDSSDLVSTYLDSWPTPANGSSFEVEVDSDGDVTVTITP